MDSEEYMKDRLDDQIKWYDNKSTSAQKSFKTKRHWEIVLAALIPFITALNGFFSNYNTYGLIMIGLLGVIISILAGFIAFGKHQEHWIEYRTICESLKKEKYLFQTSVEPYDSDNSFDLLVLRVEALVSKENTNWSQYMMKQKKGDNNS